MILLAGKVGLVKTQRLTAVRQFFPPGRKPKDASEQGSHSSPFPRPLQKRNSCKLFRPCSARQQRTRGLPRMLPHRCWMLAGYQWTKCEAEQNKIRWAKLGLHAQNRTVWLQPRVEVIKKIFIMFEVRWSSTWNCLGTEIKTRKQEPTAGVFSDWFRTLWLLGKYLIEFTPWGSSKKLVGALASSKPDRSSFLFKEFIYF